MKLKALTREEVIGLLKKQQGERSIRQFAIDLGISAAYLSDVYLGKRDPGPSVLGILNLKRQEEVKYVTS